jgi:hypothetical protein
MATPVKLTEEEILKLYDDTKKVYDTSGIYDKFRQDDQFYELDFKSLLGLPDEYLPEGIVLPTARDMVDACVDNTAISNVRVKTSIKKDDPKGKKQSEILRKFALGVLYRNQIENSLSPIRAASKHYWLHGLAVLKTVWDADRYVGKPERKDGQSDESYADVIDKWRDEEIDSIPIVIQAIHPMNIMLDPYYNGGLFVFETTEELMYDVQSKFPQWKNPQNKTVNQVVTHIQYWSKHFRCDFYDREAVYGVKPHNYGFIPYVSIDSGLGNISFDNDPKKRYVGVLRYIKDLLISESRDYSIADVILKNNAFPWMTIEGDGADAVTEIAAHFGEATRLPKDTTITERTHALPPDQLMQHLALSKEQIESHSAPRATRGLGESGVRSGADRQVIASQAGMRFQYSNEAFRSKVAKALTNCARIFKHVIPGDINVFAKTPNDEFDIEIKKEDIQEPLTFFVEFTDVQPEDEYRRHDDLIRMVNGGIYSVEYARQQLPNVDAEQITKQQRKEMIRNSQVYMQFLTQTALAVLTQKVTGLQIAENILAPAQSTVPPSGAGQGSSEVGSMTTGVPEVATPGSAEDIQNQLGNMRSQTPMSATQGRNGGGNWRS